VRQNKVHVIALLGLVEYIDRDMTRDEARKEYLRLKHAGWKEGDAVEFEKAGGVRTMQAHIYS
jgi:hypothetical protein